MTVPSFRVERATRWSRAGQPVLALVVLSLKWGVHPFLAVPLAGMTAALIALPTAALVFRLRGAYLAVGTWVAAEVFRLLVTNTMWVGGGNGLSVIAVVKDVPLWWREAATLWLAIGLGLTATLGLYVVLRSRFGLRGLLSDLGAWYLIVLGLLAVVVMLKMPEGLYGALCRRFDITLFPVQRRVHLSGDPS